MGSEQNREPKVVLDGFSFLECPRWHDGRLWLSDFYTGRVIATDENGAVEVVAEVPNQPSGLGFLPDGRLLIVSMKDRRLLVRDHAGTLSEYADLSKVLDSSANDMLVDDLGRAYVGSFGFDLMGGAEIRTANLVRVDPDRSVTVVAEDLAFPNGMAILPSGELVLAESLANGLTAFDIADNGDLVNRRVWAEFGPVPQTRDVAEAMSQLTVSPDGICTDAEGAVWAADCLHGRVVRVAGGRIVDEIQAGTGVFACMLGGSDGRTLFMCAAPSFFEHERRPVREGQLLAVRVDVPRGGRP